jgi:hypothetical protein
LKLASKIPSHLKHHLQTTLSTSTMWFFLSTAIFIRQAVCSWTIKTNLGIFCKCISRVGSDAELGLAIHYALMPRPLPMYLLSYVKCWQLGK